MLVGDLSYTNRHDCRSGCEKTMNWGTTGRLGCPHVSGCALMNRAYFETGSTVAGLSQQYTRIHSQNPRIGEKNNVKRRVMGRRRRGASSYPGVAIVGVDGT